MKYKASDWVRVKSKAEIDAACIYLTPTMNDYAGQTARITEVSANGNYHISIDPDRF
jgi:hypothetical protein